MQLTFHTLDVFTDKRLVASGVAPPRPSLSAVTDAAGAEMLVTLAAKLTLGELITVVPSAPITLDPILTTVVEPLIPPVPRLIVEVLPAAVAPLPML